MQEGSERQPIYANKTVLTVGTVIALVLTVIGPVMWAAKKEAEIAITRTMCEETKSRVSVLEARIADTDVWRGRLEVTLGNMAKEVSEIKKYVER